MPMVFLVLAVLAVGMIVALLVGVTLKLVGLLIMTLLVVATVTWLMRKIRGPEAKGVTVLDADRRERLRR